MKFLPTSSYKDDVIDPYHIHGVISASIENESAVVAILETDGGKYAGCFMGIVSEGVLSPRKTCAEVFFWVDQKHRGHGRKLLSFVEDWAVDAGCTDFVLSAPVSSDRAGKVFKAWKFQHTESWYRKRIV